MTPSKSPLRTGKFTSARPSIIRAIRDLEDIGRRAQLQRDRSIGMSAVDALGGLLQDYLPLRSQLPSSWFEISGRLSRDPDFVSLAPSSRSEIESNGTWLETKVLRTHLTLFEDALGANRDLANLIALNTRTLGEKHFEGKAQGIWSTITSRCPKSYRPTIN